MGAEKIVRGVGTALKDPHKAGVRLFIPSVPLGVIPAQAGIHLPGGGLDSRIRGNDRPGSVLSDHRFRTTPAPQSAHPHASQNVPIAGHAPAHHQSTASRQTGCVDNP
jgi:hypothetical protein